MRYRVIIRQFIFAALLTTLAFSSLCVMAEARVISSGVRPSTATVSANEGANITIYNQNRALIKEKHSFELVKGLNQLDCDGVAPFIDLRSVSLRSTNGDKPIEVKEQSYQHDLISPGAILSRYMGKNVHLKHFLPDGRSEEQTGILLGSSSPYDCVIKVGDRYVLGGQGQIEVNEIPPGLFSQPKLSFVIKAPESGKKDLILTYETNNMSWQGDYNLVLNSAQDKFDLTGWITLNNQCGLNFKNANLKLIAGSVQNNSVVPMPRVYAAMAKSADAAPQEQAFADYHLYTWPEPVDINNNETKMLTLIERKDVPVTKKYIFDREYYIQSNPKQKFPVQIKLEFQNDEKNKRPLPAGQVKVYQEDADNELQLIGEDSIQHTAVGEKITIKVGEAFDVIGERTRVNVEQTDSHHRKDTYKVVFTNHLNKDISVTDIEHVPDLGVFTSDLAFSKINSNTFEKDVKISANSSAELNYTIEYKI